MRIGYYNPKETFKEYYKRFLSIISALHLKDRYKIEILKSNLLERLTNRTLRILRNIDFVTFYTNLKATDLDLRLSD